ncbi:GumC domain-containing protein [Devosia rhizoryzae]|uniref:Polysaccharide chain length determinant N-terminal domain-containing protein n=1 Tax=Devosia rhizoryzae TaxID=2774137 RepID=A0ABX7C2D6_9HYPH|nr:Wzz/FepE/Etk N-terminal domain-containing protein [Devosia rhizoryzae]QQR38388.1 hypothetical protein JI748_11410 [Devosia rhizoryzae]
MENQVDGEIRLLDIAVVVAENWLLLILVPLLAGVISFGVISTTTPRVYETEALLAIDEREAALVRAAPVLDKAIADSSSFAGYTGSLSEARRELLQNSLTVSKEADSEFYRLRVRGYDPLNAEELLGAIIDALISNSVPDSVQLDRINREIEQASASLEELETGLAKVNSILANTDEVIGISNGELGASIVAIVSSIEHRRAELFRLELAINGTVQPEDVVQPPTEPVATSRGLLLPVLAVVLGVGFFLLILAFLREGLRKASADPAQVAKVNRIRSAFWLKPLAE